MTEPRIAAVVVGLREEDRANELARDLDISLVNNEPDLPKDKWEITVRPTTIYELAWAMKEPSDPAAAKGLEALVQVHLRSISAQPEGNPNATQEGPEQQGGQP